MMMADANSNPIQTYVNDVGELMHTAFGKNSGITPAAFAHTIANDFKRKVNMFWDNVTDSNNKIKHDDNIYVPIQQKTLLGNDFATLYNGTIHTDTLDTDQGAMQFLSPSTNYETEMRSGYCTFPEPTSYDMLSTHDKAVYEIALLSKAYVSCYDGTNIDEISQNYNNMMQQYKAACESNGLCWEDILHTVSSEFQAENYRSEQNGSVEEFNMASKAHALMLSAAPEGFHDDVDLAYIGEFTKNDMLSENGSEVVGERGFIKSLLHGGHGAIAVSAGVIGSVWSNIKNKANELIGVAKDKVDDTKPYKAVSSIVSNIKNHNAEATTPQAAQSNDFVNYMNATYSPEYTRYSDVYQMADEIQQSAQGSDLSLDQDDI